MGLLGFENKCQVLTLYQNLSELLRLLIAAAGKGFNLHPHIYNAPNTKDGSPTAFRLKQTAVMNSYFYL